MNTSIHSKIDYPFDYFFEKTSAEGASEPCDTDHLPASDSARLDCSSSSDSEGDNNVQ